FRDRELGPAEGGGERGVLQLCPGPLDAVGQDAVVVEGELLRGRVADRSPAGRGGVPTGHRRGQVGQQREVSDGDHPAARVAARGSVAGELLQVSGGRVEAGLFEQLAYGRLRQVLVEA